MDRNTKPFPDPAGSGNGVTESESRRPVKPGKPTRRERRKPAARGAGIGVIGVTEQGHERRAAQRRRTRHTGEIKGCRIAISVSEQERQELETAARENRLTVSAFVAAQALAAARGQAPEAAGPLRDVLLNLNHATAQLQRAGTNFNQAVAELNATGQAPGNLMPYGRYTAKVAARVKEAADEIQRRLP